MEAERYANALYKAEAVRLTDSEARDAATLVEALSEPCGRSAAAKELGRLKVLTRERNLSHDDLVAQIAVYAEELSAYPIDVVREACRDWANREKWFPAWAELRALCEEQVKMRRDLMAELARRKPEPQSNDGITEKDRETVKARMAELKRTLGTAAKPMLGALHRGPPRPRSTTRHEQGEDEGKKGRASGALHQRAAAPRAEVTSEVE